METQESTAETFDVFSNFPFDFPAAPVVTDWTTSAPPTTTWTVTTCSGG